ncbi:Bidirectional sugar transporter SWEET [Heracleum sosnowskyi]|uniref:Bidirectional sugar transporter SWEET n=1 Tax=Heracleum sosnowskyi TaxID=360622 RepID=A0AAD8LZ77_9APIA|nr:Bidirectional sugar transporter SWEET [Heracleum sosnowskyi]
MSLLYAQTLTICKDAAGNIFAFGLFISPIPTFRRITRIQCTEDFSGLPYLYALLNCLICAWYGTLFMSDDNVLVTTVNTVGAMFQLTCVILYIAYAEKSKKVNTFVLLMGIFGVFAIIISASLFLLDRPTRHVLVGFLTCASLISMFASPLFIIRLVIRTKSVEFMPFYLSLSTFAMSVCFMLYGIFNFDPFVYIPNGIGTILGTVQLALFLYYERKDTDHSREPLIESFP